MLCRRHSFLCCDNYYCDFCLETHELESHPVVELIA
jgi:hypothetical protein